KAATALDRFGHVEEIAAMVAFVAGPESSYINGDESYRRWRNECLNQRRNDMRAMRAETFSGYEGLKLIEHKLIAALRSELTRKIDNGHENDHRCKRSEF